MSENIALAAIFNLALKNHQENKLDVAQDLYNQVLEIDPNHLGAHNNLGVSFKALGENQKAKKCYQKAIKINPNNVDAHYNLGVALQLLGQNQKAKECYEKAIKIDPNYANA